jgi:hypothetical protein
MLLPARIIVPCLVTFPLYSWQHRRVDPKRRSLNVVAGRMTVANVGLLGDLLYRRHPGRVSRLYRRMVRISVASFAGAYCLLWRLAPCETG